MRKTNKTEVIVLHETVAQSYIKDAGSAIAALSLILPGHFLGSTVLEFVGGLLFVFITLGAVSKEINKGRTTLEEGRAKIDAMIAARGLKE